MLFIKNLVINVFIASVGLSSLIAEGPSDFLKEVQVSQDRSLDGDRHNDYDPSLLEKHLNEKLSYAEWKNLPRGTKLEPDSGKDAYIISLTTHPGRTKRGTRGIWLTIETLMRQEEKPDRIILWLSLEEYPEGRKHLPQTLIDLEERGLEIRFVKGNARAANKLLPAFVNRFKANIITVDDDILYPPQLLSVLRASHKKHPKAIIGNCFWILKKARGIIKPYSRGFVYEVRGLNAAFEHKHTLYVAIEQNPLAVANGFMGVLYPYDPTAKTLNGLHLCVINPSFVKKYGMSTDDLWFHACRVLAGTDGWSTGVTNHFTVNDFSDEGGLRDQNMMAGFGNDLAMIALLKDFPAFREALKAQPSKKHCRFSRWGELWLSVKLFLGLQII